MFNFITKEEKQRDAFARVTGYKSMKDAKNDPRFVKSLMAHGNRKLKDYIVKRDGDSDNTNISEIFSNFKYAQFNLLAKSTCPYATTGCKKFCYAKRDERYPNVVFNRQSSMNASKDPDFVDNMIFTINCLLYSKRYYGSVLVLRIHESGDFYNQGYLNNWLSIINYFLGRENIVFQFYTKCFDYILNLSDANSTILAAGLENNNIGLSLSIDDTTTPVQVMKAYRIKSMYPNVNIYKVVTDGDTNGADHLCDCAHCAKCGHCILTTDETVMVNCH